MDTSRKGVCATCQWTQESARPLAYHETYLRTNNKNNFKNWSQKHEGNENRKLNPQACCLPLADGGRRRRCCPLVAERGNDAITARWEFHVVVVTVATGIRNRNWLWLRRWPKVEFGYFNIRLTLLLPQSVALRQKSSRTWHRSQPGMFWFATARERDVLKKTVFSFLA